MTEEQTCPNCLRLAHEIVKLQNALCELTDEYERLTAPGEDISEWTWPESHPLALAWDALGINQNRIVRPTPPPEPVPCQSVRGRWSHHFDDPQDQRVRGL